MADAIAREATRAALSIRRDRNVQRDQPVNPFDLAMSVGASVRFLDVKTMEGMFARVPAPTIYLPSTQHRPYGRISFSCAHELGHFQLGHIVSVDEIGPVAHSTADELGANTFASWLLMPRQAVVAAFERRNFDPAKVSNMQLIAVACDLGVSIDALAKHMTYTLGITSKTWLSGLARFSIKKTLMDNIGTLYVKRTVVVDKHWQSQTIDVDVADRIVFLDCPPQWHLSKNTTVLDQSNISGQDLVVVEAATSGIDDRKGAPTIRVARRHFCGLCKYRFMED